MPPAVPAAQLPSFVDDVVEADNFAALPVTGEAGKIYVTKDDGATFRWACEDAIGYSGTFDPKFEIASDGTIYATTFDGLRVSRDGGCTFQLATEDRPMTEADGELGTGFSVEVAKAWERALFADDLPATRRVALRLIEDNVVVSAIAPGAFVSDMNILARDKPEEVPCTVERWQR